MIQEEPKMSETKKTCITLNAPELAKLLGISRSAAYNLMHRADFPSFRIGKRLLVTQDKVFEWVDAQTSAHAQLTFD